MSLYVIRYSGYMENMDISDFETLAEAQAFVSASDRELGPSWSFDVIKGPTTFTTRAPKWRTDLFNLLAPPDIKTGGFETLIDAEALWERMILWFKEAPGDA